MEMCRVRVQYPSRSRKNIIPAVQWRDIGFRRSGDCQFRFWALTMLRAALSSPSSYHRYIIDHLASASESPPNFEV